MEVTAEAVAEKLPGLFSGVCGQEPAAFAEGTELAVQDLGLAFNALEQALAGMNFAEARDIEGTDWRFRPRGFGRWKGQSELFFEVEKALLDEFEPGLNGEGGFPSRFARQRGEGSDGLRKPSEIGDESDREVCKGKAPRPGFGEEAFEGLFRIVVGQASATARLGELSVRGGGVTP